MSRGRTPETGLGRCRDLQALAAWVGCRDLQAMAEGRGACVLLSKSVWDSEPVRLALKVVESRKNLCGIWFFLLSFSKLNMNIYKYIYIYLYTI